MKPRPKKCDICGTQIQNRRSTLQVVCSLKCAAELTKKKEAAKRKAETRRMREELMTHSQWLSKLQAVFNSFIRKRDRQKGCISCGRAFHGKYDAGHFYTVGAHPELRFDEDNVHGQCVYCNQHKHGNIALYEEGLRERMGDARLEALKSRRGQVLKLTVDEIKERITEYKSKAK